MDEALIKRVLPHSVEAEQSVIGSMLMDREAIIAASEIITGADFYQQQYGVMFECDGGAVQRRKAGRSGHASEPAEGKGCSAGGQQPGLCPGYHDHLCRPRSMSNRMPISCRKRQSCARLIKVNEEIANTLLRREGDKLEDILAAHGEIGVSTCSRAAECGDFVPIRQVALNVLEKIEAASKSKGTVTGIPTGFIDLDYRTSGIPAVGFYSDCGASFDG